MDIYELRGIGFIEKGIKKLNSLWLTDSKIDQANEYFNQAGVQFVLAKKWIKAIDAYIRVAECSRKLKNMHEVATSYVLVATYFHKCNNIKEEIDYLRISIDIFSDLGKFMIAARYQLLIAELYDTDNDMDNALTNYRLAADLFVVSNANSIERKCKLKIAELLVGFKQYEEPIKIYEDIAIIYIDSSSLRYDTKKYLLRAGLCHLVTNNFIIVKKTINKYIELDVTFDSTREYQLLLLIIDAIEEEDLDKYKKTIIDYDKRCILDGFSINILLTIKNKFFNDDIL
jgi:alpha-soluble NSF attachment protein